MPPHNETIIEDLHVHQVEHHKTVIRVLSSIARDTDLPLPLVRSDFIEGDLDATILFWERLNDLHPGRYRHVSWCHGCRKFNLEEVTH